MDERGRPVDRRARPRRCPNRLARDTADTLAAVTSGLASLTAGAARHMGAGNVNQVIVEMDGGYLFVTSISEGSALAVMSRPRRRHRPDRLRDEHARRPHRPGAHARRCGRSCRRDPVHEPRWRRGTTPASSPSTPSPAAAPGPWASDLTLETLVTTTDQGVAYPVPPALRARPHRRPVPRPIVRRRGGRTS